MQLGWNDRVAAVGRAADDAQPAHARAPMRRLIDERPSQGPIALHVWTSVHGVPGLSTTLTGYRPTVQAYADARCEPDPPRDGELG